MFGWSRVMVTLHRKMSTKGLKDLLSYTRQALEILRLKTSAASATMVGMARFE